MAANGKPPRVTPPRHPSMHRGGAAPGAKQTSVPPPSSPSAPALELAAVDTQTADRTLPEAGLAPADDGCDDEGGKGWLTALSAVRRSAKTRKLSSSQTDALLMAVGLRLNLLMRGPAGTGKRWILRHVAHTLGQLGEGVELLTKFFNVLPNGQLVLDRAALPFAWSQLQRASVIVIDDVPSQPAAATAFFAYLDLICRIARCQAAPTAVSAAASDDAAAAYKRWRLGNDGGTVSCDEAPEQLPFGGIQVLATQNHAHSSAKTETHPELAWSSSSSAGGAGAPGAPGEAAGRLGVVISSTGSPSPHDTIKIVVFQ
jgi:hypothetical protein